MTNQTENRYFPNYAVPPGEILEEELESRGMSEVELSQRTGLVEKTITEIIKAKAPITPEIALKFEGVFRQPADYWLNLERFYREALVHDGMMSRLRQATSRLLRKAWAYVASLSPWVRVPSITRDFSVRSK